MSLATDRTDARALLPGQTAPDAGVITNPVLAPLHLHDGLPPFNQIRPEHFERAFEQAMREHRAEMAAIVQQDGEPTFDNTIARFDAAGLLLERTDLLFGNLVASLGTAELLAVEQRMAPVLAAHHNAIYLNQALFDRIDALHSQRDHLGLDAQSRRLLERIHKTFVMSGAHLRGAARERYGQITQCLAELGSRFDQNLLADEAAWHLVLDDAALRELPDAVRDAARGAAADRGLDGHVVPLSRSHLMPFLTSCPDRVLREKAWRAWVQRGAHDGERDNRPVMRELLALRAELAALMGCASYADHALKDRMAQTPAAVMDLLTSVWQRALVALQAEQAQLRDEQMRAGDTTSIEAWDWRYWAQRVRERTHAIDDAEVRPYFSLDAMVQAAFDCATRLFGIHFKARPDVRAYHPDVTVWEVTHGDGHALGWFLQDNFARPGKRGGAWMSSLRLQQGAVTPVVTNNNNVARASAGQPSLLSFDDVRTLFHEFGHGLYGLLSQVRWRSLSGTHVLQDFAELPSQLFEHWISEPEVLQRHARHAQTGEPIPRSLIDRLLATERLGQAFETLSYTASALVDMAVHSLPPGDAPQDMMAFEDEVLTRHGLPPVVEVRHRLSHLYHIAGSSYAAGYYVYQWAQVLDADAYDAFREAGDPFDAATAQRLRECIYASGNTREPGEAYRAFRGRDPKIELLMRKLGLLAEMA